MGLIENKMANSLVNKFENWKANRVNLEAMARDEQSCLKWIYSLQSLPFQSVVL